MAIQFPRKTRILANEQAGSAGRILRLDCRLDFTPGQLVSLSQTLPGPSRLYSIASSPDNPSLDIIYNLVEDGILTPELWQLQPGNEILLQGPRGSFGEPGHIAENQHLWWICNGTGVSPFISLLRHFKITNNPSTQQRTLVFGCRTPSDAWFLDELIEAANERGLRCILCFSAVNARHLVHQHSHLRSFSEWHAKSEKSHKLGVYLHFGRLTAWSGWSEIPVGDMAMLCGSSLMIADVRDKLLSGGMEASHIFAETYF